MIVSEPMSPKEITEIIYEKCMPYNPVEAVLQQEVKQLNMHGYLVCCV